MRLYNSVHDLDKLTPSSVDLLGPESEKGGVWNYRNLRQKVLSKHLN